MHAAVALTSFLMVLGGAPADGDNGASRWGDSWVAYSNYKTNHPGASGQGGRGGSGFSNCHTIPGANGVTYIQCESGPSGQENVFEGVGSGDPAAPAVTPEMLLAQALRQLRPTAPQVSTAPPRGQDGLVGLRHFFWAQSTQWHPIRERATAGPVWAEVTATPTALVINPGSGQPSITCKGPGTPYDQSKSPDAQKTDCAHLFARSSAGLPGSQYKVTASVVWTANWIGSGGAGGALAPITTSTVFPLRIAEGQALIQGSR